VNWYWRGVFVPHIEEARYIHYARKEPVSSMIAARDGFSGSRKSQESSTVYST